MKSVPGFRFAAIAVALVSAAAIGLSAVTFASYSSESSASPTRAGAATVLLGRDGAPPDVSFVDLAPGVETRPFELTVTYDGSVAADVELALGPGAAAPLCRPVGDRLGGTVGAAVLVRIDGGPSRGYCELVGGEPLVRVPAMRPGATVTHAITVELSGLAGPEVARLARDDTLTVTASAPRGGFTDAVSGSFGFRIGDIPEAVPPGGAETDEDAPTADSPAPGVLTLSTDAGPVTVTDPAVVDVEVPEECLAAGMTREGFVAVVRLDPGTTRWSPGTGGLADDAGPLLVLATDEDSEITGGDRADCIVGGAGADLLAGGPGDDVLLGRSGPDRLVGGPGDDLLFGGVGADDLRGQAGDDRLDGGPDGAAGCDAIDDRAAGRGCPPVVGTDPEPQPAEPAADGAVDGDDITEQAEQTEPLSGQPATGEGAAEAGEPAVAEPGSDATGATDGSASP